MFNKLLRYIDENFLYVGDVVPLTATSKQPLMQYALKNITQDFRAKFESFCKDKHLSVNTDIEKKSFFSLRKPLTLADTELLIEKYNGCLGENGCRPSEFPNAYKEFLLTANGILCVGTLNIYGSKGLDPEYGALGLVKMTNDIRPDCIDKNFLHIGDYMLNYSPIYVNRQGNIFVYDGDAFNEIKHIKPLKKYAEAHRKLQMRLIGYWESFEDYIISEIERLTVLYKASPWHLNTPKEVLPNNITSALNSLKGVR